MKSLLLLLLLASIAWAQKPDEHTCRILFLNGPDNAPEKLILFDGVGSQEVALPRLNLSPVYKLRPGNLKLHLLTTAPIDPKAIPEGAPSVMVPASASDFYLIVTNDRSNAVVPVQMQLVNANAKHLGRGEMLWFNLTKKTIAGQVGTEKVVLKPSSRSVVKAPARTKGDHAVDLYFRLPDDDFVYPLCKTRWRHNPQIRKLVFIFEEGKRRSPRIQAFTDFRAPEKPKGSG